MSAQLERRLFQGFINLHILFHAGCEPVYGMWLMDELEHHGYKLSPGTLYPLLHRLEADGLLAQEKRLVAGKVRKYYYCTAHGKAALADARKYLAELVKEIGLEANESV